MSTNAITHTLAIFDRLSKELPPLVPSSVSDRMENASRELRQEKNLTLSELEDKMITFGREIWGYREAFLEFLDSYDKRLGDNFFVSHLELPLRKRYADFIEKGGSRRDIEVGKSLSFFSIDERLQLRDVCIRARSELRAYTTQAVLSVDRARYEKKIEAFQHILSNVDEKLDALRSLEMTERPHHPLFADEINEHIRSFEFGLCALGPKMTYDDVCSACEHFSGRIDERKMKR